MPYKDPQKARECWARREQKPERIAYKKQWHSASDRVNSYRKYYWKQLYKLTPEKYYDMLVAQAGGCAICGKAPKPGKVLCVDHNHKTGAVRGLLCAGCNHALGVFGDTTTGLRKAIQYLESFDTID